MKAEVKQMLKVGVIGCGKIAQVRHIPEYLDNPDCQLVALFDLNAERTNELAAKYKCKAYASYEELLKERRSLLRRIREFERDYRKNSDNLLLVARCPSPDVEYLCNLMYLAELCNLISDKFIEKRDGEIPY